MTVCDMMATAAWRIEMGDCIPASMSWDTISLQALDELSRDGNGSRILGVRTVCFRSHILDDGIKLGM